MAVDSEQLDSILLQGSVSCPHCWEKFAPHEALWIAQHADLVGDPRLGPDQQQRFLPTRFNVRGDAIDSRGFPSTSLACPKCHLEVPRAMFELASIFGSILGAPASGKSYLLAAMTWQLRRELPKRFGLSFGDVDPAFNRSLNAYEDQLFLSGDPDRIIAIRKTELQGELYDTVLYGDQTVSYPRPFLFSIRPLQNHPNFAQAGRVGRIMCLYDNAGEHFLPGQDTVSSPVTRHIAQSRFLFFLFDPTQDARFRDACKASSRDPQLLDQARNSRQETILHEAADRIRRYTGLSQTAKHKRPLIVVVTKFDVWKALLGRKELPSPWVLCKELSAIDLDTIEGVSREVRTMLWNRSPEIVSAAESLAEEVYYVPVSATGCAPTLDTETKVLGVRPRDMHPQWVEMPMLFAMARWGNGLLPYKSSRREVAPPQPTTSM